MSAADLSQVRLELDVPATAPVGSTIPITLRVENLRDEPTELTLRGRTIAFDVVVRHADGRVVWRRLDGAMIPGIARLEVLEARAVLEFLTEWRLVGNDHVPVTPGVYELEGVLLTDGPDLRTPPMPLLVMAVADS
jgi:hypothetical protein